MMMLGALFAWLLVALMLATIAAILIGGKRRERTAIGVGRLLVVGILLVLALATGQVAQDASAPEWTVVGDVRAQDGALRMLHALDGDARGIRTVRFGGMSPIIAWFSPLQGAYNPLLQTVWLKDEAAIACLPHEIGHHVWYRATPEQRRGWAERWLEEDAFISAYAQTSPAEDFAESYAAYRSEWEPMLTEWRKEALTEILYGGG